MTWYQCSMPATHLMAALHSGGPGNCLEVLHEFGASIGIMQASVTHDISSTYSRTIAFQGLRQLYSGFT